jgi:hypothetical protein
MRDKINQNFFSVSSVSRKKIPHNSPQHKIQLSHDFNPQYGHYNVLEITHELSPPCPTWGGGKLQYIMRDKINQNYMKNEEHNQRNRGAISFLLQKQIKNFRTVSLVFFNIIL